MCNHQHTWNIKLVLLCKMSSYYVTGSSQFTMVDNKQMQYAS